MAEQQTTAAKIDRQTTTPFLLKLFYKSGSWHRLDEFSPNTSTLPPHLQIYTWPSCTLRELTHLLTSALPSLLPSPAAGTRVAFRLVFPDTRPQNNDPSRPGRFLSKDLGSVVVGAPPAPTDEVAGIATAASNGDAIGTLEGEPDKMLQDARFVIGDYVSCAIVPPTASGGVAPAPSGGPPPRSGYGGGMSRGGAGGVENSFGGSFRGRGPRGGGLAADFPRGMRPGDGGVPMGEWRRGEMIPDRDRDRDRDRGGFGGGGGGGGGYRGRGRGRGW